MPFDSTNFNNDGLTAEDRWHLKICDELERVLDNIPEDRLNQDREGVQ